MWIWPTVFVVMRCFFNIFMEISSAWCWSGVGRAGDHMVTFQGPQTGRSQKLIQLLKNVRGIHHKNWVYNLKYTSWTTDNYHWYLVFCHWNSNLSNPKKSRHLQPHPNGTDAFSLVAGDVEPFVRFLDGLIDTRRILSSLSCRLSRGFDSDPDSCRTWRAF